MTPGIVAHRGTFRQTRGVRAVNDKILVQPNLFASQSVYR